MCTPCIQLNILCIFFVWNTVYASHVRSRCFKITFPDTLRTWRKGTFLKNHKMYYYTDRGKR